MPSWTPMQKAAINQRGADILVSAAAGSGKTAVLTERVLNRILGVNEETPIELDRFLIVTFTSAAAQEMKERITHKLSSVMNGLAELPEENQEQLEYLERQMALVPQASISTVHAFCLKTIRAYFNRLDIDPNIKVGNEAELSMMRQEILEDLLENYLEEQAPDFMALAEVYGSLQGLEPLKNLILEVSTFAKSTLFPEIWLKEQVKKLKAPYASIDDMPWAESFRVHITNTLSDLNKIYDKARAICDKTAGPMLYKEAVESDQAQLQAIDVIQSLETVIHAINEISFVAFSRKKQECDPDLKEQVKAYRDVAKKVIKGLQEDLAYVKDTKLFKQLPQVGQLMETLVQVIEAFESRYRAQKQEAGVVDYNDLEHLCLELLIVPELSEAGEVTGIHYTEVAKELSEFYQEVYMDEYQDTNTVQETLLRAVAEANDEKGATRFMVGDMKQSIYRFRLANPLIFAEKYQTWSKYEDKRLLDPCQICIDLSQNFRSRENILEGVNDLFEQVMSPAVGELAYDEYAKLRVGNLYEEGHLKALPEESLSDAIEVHLLETKEQDSEEENELADLKNAECEAKMVAELIDQLLKGEGNPTHVFDKDLGDYRKVEAKDIVILLRALSNKASIYENALISKGIGAYAEVSSDFFEALEIQTMTSLLKIIDNPLQDIPLITVLRSPILGLSLDDLVQIRKTVEEGCFYEALKSYLSTESEEASSQAVREKLQEFMILFNKYREESSTLKTEELLARLYVETGYYRYVAMLPNGAKKKANLDLLKKYASEYESNNHGKLFGFLQYLDKLSSTPNGLKEAKLVDGNENLVRIMSIHKSKGLEFSVVFVCDTGKSFNDMDTKKDVLMHSELGLAPSFVDTTEFVKYPTLPKLAMKQQIKAENVSEEMRVLYVALTRAKEKLFITGTIKDIEKSTKKWQLFSNRKEKAIMPLGVKQAGSYLNWIGMSLYSHIGVDYFRNLVKDEVPILFEGKSKWQVKTWSKEKLSSMQESHLEVLEDKKALLHNWDTEKVYSEYKEEISRRLSFTYPHEKAVLLPTKVSVSEIKRNTQLTEEVEGYTIQLYPEVEVAPAPRFIQTEEVLAGAKRGTLIHSVFEQLDYLKYQDEAAIKEEVNRLVAENRLSEEVLKVVSFKRLAQMAQSDVVAQMSAAQYIEKEKAFMYLAKASLVDVNYPEDEDILIQGVIDAFFVNEEGITLVDYKTDYVDPKDIEGAKERIKQRYKKQLEFYAMALEDITKISVAHRYIYLYNINEWMYL